MLDLIEASRKLDLSRFVGSAVVVRAAERGHIIKYENPRGWQTSSEDSYIPLTRRPKKVSSEIASFHPSRGVIRVAPAVMSVGSHAWVAGRTYYDVSPFDHTTGQQVVDIKLK
jgi:hypothetical protein